MKHLILLMFVAMFVSCESNETTDNNSDLGDENCILTTDLWENGGGGGEDCEYQNSDNSFKRQLIVGCSFESSSSETSERFIVEKFEFGQYHEMENVGLKGKCIEKCKDDDWCGIGFVGVDKSFFKDSLIGKEVSVYKKEGFYGDINGESISRDVQVVRHKDGELIAVTGQSIVNEGDESESGGIWPSKYAPEVSVKQEVIPSCESFCVKYKSGASMELEGDLLYDSLIAPPLKITIEGKKPVVVSNGEVVTSEGYEYFVRNSIRATEEDDDGHYFTSGVPRQFDFFIVNTEALK